MDINKGQAVVGQLNINPADMPATVMDAESGETIAITPEMIVESQLAHEQIALGHVMIYYGLQAIHDKKLYLARGHQSFTDYVETELRMSKTKAYQAIELARAFTEDKLGSLIDELGQTRALVIARLPEDVRKEFLEREQLALPDGKVYSKKELEEMKAKEVEKLRKQFDSRQRLQNKNHTDEIEGMKTEMAELERLLSQATENSEPALKEIYEKRLRKLQKKLDIKTIIPENFDKQLNTAERMAYDALADLERLAEFAVLREREGRNFIQTIDNIKIKTANTMQYYGDLQADNRADN